MKRLLEYLNSLPVVEQAVFAGRCGTTVGYLRKAVSVGQRLNAEVCINIERESHGAVPCETLRPEVDWAYLRNSALHEGSAVLEQSAHQAPAHQAQAAINSEALHTGVAHV